MLRKEKKEVQGGLWVQLIPQKNAFILWQNLLLSQRTSVTSKRFVLNCRYPFLFLFIMSAFPLQKRRFSYYWVSIIFLFPFIFFSALPFFFFFLFIYFFIPVLEIDRSKSVVSRLDEQKHCSLFHWKTVFSWTPTWQLWDTNVRLKTLGLCALFIPLRANMCIITKGNVQQAIM